MLNQVADGVWVRRSAWVWSNAIVVRGEGGLILVDPGIDGSIRTSSPMTWTGSAFRWSPVFPPVPTGTTCSGIPG